MTQTSADIESVPLTTPSEDNTPGLAAVDASLLPGASALALQRSLPRQVRHDLRSKLNQIIGYSELLMDEAQEQGEHPFFPDLQRIYMAGRELLTIINTHVDPITKRADNATSDVPTNPQPAPLGESTEAIVEPSNNG